MTDLRSHNDHDKWRMAFSNKPERQGRGLQKTCRFGASAMTHVHDGGRRDTPSYGPRALLSHWFQPSTRFDPSALTLYGSPAHNH